MRPTLEFWHLVLKKIHWCCFKPFISGVIYSSSNRKLIDSPDPIHQMWHTRYSQTHNRWDRCPSPWCTIWSRGKSISSLRQGLDCLQNGVWMEEENFPKYKRVCTFHASSVLGNGSFKQNHVYWKQALNNTILFHICSELLCSESAKTWQNKMPPNLWLCNPGNRSSEQVPGDSKVQSTSLQVGTLKHAWPGKQNTLRWRI